MKIALDINQINRDGGGISYVMKGLVRSLSSFSQHQFFLIVRNSQDLEQAFRAEGGLQLPSNCQVLELPATPKIFGGGFTWYWKLSKVLSHQKVDVLVSPTLSPASLFFRRNLQIVNDLSPISKQFYFSLRDRWQFGMLLGLAAQFAWKIATISQATKDEFLQKFSEYTKPIKVIPLGLNAWVTQPVSSETLRRVQEKYQLPQNFILSSSTLQPRKNYPNMIRGFVNVLSHYPDMHYVITGGKGWDYTSIFELVSKLNLGGRVHFLGYVPDEDIAAIFKLANAFAYVSFEEGFGLPLIEARAMELPVVASNIPVFTEMKLDDAVLLADPNNSDQIGDMFIKALGMGKSTVSSEFREYYTWTNTWDQLLDAIAAK